MNSHFSAEKQESLFFVAVGLVAIGVSAWLWTSGHRRIARIRAPKTIASRDHPALGSGQFRSNLFPSPRPQADRGSTSNRAAGVRMSFGTGRGRQANAPPGSPGAATRRSSTAWNPTPNGPPSSATWNGWRKPAPGCGTAQLAGHARCGFSGRRQREEGYGNYHIPISNTATGLLALEVA